MSVQQTTYKICFQHEIFGQLHRQLVGFGSSENTLRHCYSH